MIEEAIKTLCELMDRFPNTYKIEIVDINDLKVHYNDDEDLGLMQEFESPLEMVEWMEENLTGT